MFDKYIPFFTHLYKTWIGFKADIQHKSTTHLCYKHYIASCFFLSPQMKSVELICCKAHIAAIGNKHLTTDGVCQIQQPIETCQ